MVLSKLWTTNLLTNSSFSACSLESFSKTSRVILSCSKYSSCNFLIFSNSSRFVVSSSRIASCLSRIYRKSSNLHIYKKQSKSNKYFLKTFSDIVFPLRSIHDTYWISKLYNLCAYWKTSLEAGMHLFKGKKSYLCDNSELCHWLFPDSDK